jgi:lysozyme-like protein
MGAGRITAVPTAEASRMTLQFDPSPPSYLSRAQVYQYAINAGFNPVQAEIATSIAMIESSGNPLAHNPNDPQGSFGLWQINQAAHPGTIGQALDPQQAANLAYQISNGGTNWWPWKNSYLRYLNAAGSGSPPGGPAAGSGQATTGAGGTSTGSPAAQSGGLLASIFSLFIRFWIFIAGIILLAIGGWAMVREGSVSGSVGDAARSAARGTAKTASAFVE